MAYTTIDDPSVYFQATTYTGAGANTVVTNSGNSNLKPDFLWIKNRGAGYGHFVVDSSRNISYAQNSSNAPYLETNSTAVENNNQNWSQSVNTDGFTTGISEHHNSNANSTFVAWQWKGNGGTTSTNTAGSIDTTVQVNADAGFSIVTFTSPGSGVYSMGHGLGTTPGFIVFKCRSHTGQWFTWHKDLSNTVTGRLSLERTDAEEFGTASWGAGVTSTLFGLSVGMLTSANRTHVAYCFAEKQGYSKFGSYKATGNSDGTTVYTGFKPAFVMIKCRTNTAEWQIYDNKRPGYNWPNYNISPNNATAQYTGEGYHNIEILSNGFKIRLTDVAVNTAKAVYTYYAFAEQPFVTSTGIPCTAS